MDPREERGQAIAALYRISQKHGFWIVPSQSGSGSYRVHLNPPNPCIPQCTCPDYDVRRKPCKHVYAVQYHLKRESNPDGSETLTETLIETLLVPKRPTYKQDWPNYNKAQTQEKNRFQALLAELCKGLAEPPIPEDKAKKGGRPRLPLADRAFCAAFKVYSLMSARRFSCDIADAHAKGYVSKLPHYNSVLNYLEDPKLTMVLRTLIQQASLPLRAVERDFAIDSSGFTSCRFVRWIDHKYGKPVIQHDWVKCHLMCGVKTNIVTGVEIDGAYAGDSPRFVPLVKATAQHFTIDEVSADKAYVSQQNMQIVVQNGGVPYILFKSNATAKTYCLEGTIYEKMFHYYSLNREEFLQHYHKRSNIESTFMMIKAKFGDSLRSKTPVAMVNETLCKILCHNLCCVIQSAFELGIEAKFWQKDEPKQAALPAPPSADDDEFGALAWL